MEAEADARRPGARGGHEGKHCREHDGERSRQPPGEKVHAVRIGPSPLLLHRFGPNFVRGGSSERRHTRS
jgi:hypothetical protein